MAEFKLSDKVNPNKIFILKTSEIEKRLDPFYYIPEIKELEKKLREKDVKPLRHFVKNVSSGATPKTAEKEKYYSDKKNGIPFLRVQNLSPTGILEYEDCKYINEETHNGYLKRSQVNGGDLLVKITGVGRMAVASVAPDDFVGNTNQHMVVIKTGSKEVSTVLASYLNSDIGEKLASRRATGGTRPALDYPALLSIPILYDKRILTITKEAVEEKNKKENEAKELLESINDYILHELGIELPQKDNSLQNRIFISSLSKISGGRLDCEYFEPYIIKRVEQISLLENVKRLNQLYISICTGFNNNTRLEKNGIVFLRTQNVRPNEIDIRKTLFTQDPIVRFTDIGDLLFTRIGVGVGDVSYNDKGKFAISDNIICLKLKDKQIGKYIAYFLNSSIGSKLLERERRDTARAIISYENILKLPIPLLTKEKQTEITSYISNLRIQAKKLKVDAKQIMIEAKAEVENIILEE